eukprot:TRINITY_DN33707_c0_g1_i1.p1 TRINITY_DN33707_c0_g1~~TRINITY_DN33707_c0_g1_i1.p1  ORF type:complete len:184 (+),score=22.11 TRINITY_DN33707_c0_g1_i1:60-554(+)
METSRSVAILAGVAFVQLLPWASPYGWLSAHAAWCWPAAPPRCTLPSVSGGSCKLADGTVVTEMTPGQSCTPECDQGKHLSGSCTSLLCPASGPEPNCIDDLSAGTWWDLCLDVNAMTACALPMELGLALQWTPAGNEEHFLRQQRAQRSVPIIQSGLHSAVQQ